MLTPGHIAISYLLAEGAKTAGLPLDTGQTVVVMLAGNISDIDFLFSKYTGKTGESHHQNITHTPVGAFIMSLIFAFLLNTSLQYYFVILTSCMLHLVLDDIGYWFYRFGLYRSKTNPQINWFYPFTKFHDHKTITDNKETLRFYLFKSWPVSILELIIIIAAAITFFSLLWKLS